MSSLRKTIAGLAASAASFLLLAGCVTTTVKTPPRYSAVVIDVEPMRAKGAGYFADEVQACMAGSATRLLGGMVDASHRGAPTLVLQISSAILNEPEADSEGGIGFTTDYMEGRALILEGKTVVEEVPMLGGYNSAWSGPNASPPTNPYRMRALCDFYTGWMRKKLGG